MPQNSELRFENSFKATGDKEVMYKRVVILLLRECNAVSGSSS